MKELFEEINAFLFDIPTIERIKFLSSLYPKCTIIFIEDDKTNIGLVVIADKDNPFEYLSDCFWLDLKMLPSTAGHEILKAVWKNAFDKINKPIQ